VIPIRLTDPVVFVTMLALFAAGAVGALLLRRRDRAANLWSHTLAVLGSALGVAFAASALWQEVTPAFSVASSFPLLTLAVRADALSAFFMLVICLIALVCSLYAPGYARQYYGRYSLGALGFFYNAFVASMILVVTVHNALAFLIVWECMSLASYFLVVYERREAANIRAGTLYFVMTHVGTAFILLAFLLMYSSTGSLEFAAIRAGLVTCAPFTCGAIFLCALIGFGTKAGIIPLHIWLPAAHPAAPSHVSALMSGVMIKTGIYMLIRVTLDLLPSAPLWWGTTILIVGALSSLFGVLYALAEHDLKRLLAYHSIENIGIILLGLGSALVFTAVDLPALAALALMAALFHTLNHATFKALLFLGAGAVISRTHTRNIERYGGLIRRMPQTAFYFLVGSMAISALPPLNGFVSEWLTFQALFHGVMTFDVLRGFPFIVAIGALAFTGGLAAACFVKVFGATFLARPRSDAAAAATEVGRAPRLAMATLALLTLLLGVGAGAVSTALARVAAGLGLPGALEWTSPLHVSLRTPDGFSLLSMPALFVGIILALGVAAVLVYVLAGRRRVRTGPTWSCGAALTPRMEITATAFSRSIITVFKGVLRPIQQTDTEYPDSGLRYFPKLARVTLELRDIYHPYLYKPLHELTDRLAEQARRIQSGNINAYIAYILVTLIVLLFVLVL
jgi:hydrogenase-4 component B